MTTAILKDNKIVTAGHGQPHICPTFGQPGKCSVLVTVPARVGYTVKRFEVEITQDDLDNQPVTIALD